MRDPTMDEHDLIRQGGIVAAAMPLFQQEMGNVERAVLNSALGLISSGKLTPDMAFQKLHEIYAIRRTLKRMEQHVTIGTSLSAELETDNG